MLSPALFLGLLFVASVLYSFTLMWLSLRPWVQARDQHWTERARWLWLARKTRTAVAMSAMGLGFILRHELAADVPGVGMVLFCTLGGFFTAQFFIDRLVWPKFSLRLWLKQTLWMLLLTSAWLGVIVWAAISTSENLESSDWLRLCVAAVLLVLIYSGIWLRALPGLRSNPHTSRLRQIVDEVTAASGVPPVRAWVMDAIMANAFALMYIRSIIVTSPAMKVLDDAELRTLVQHEMAHLCESMSVRCSRMLGGLSWLGFAFTRPVVHHFQIGGVFWLFIGVWLVRKLAANTAKSMENRADSMSVTNEAEGPVYARALEKLYQTNQMPAVMTKRLSHPDLYDRMTSAGLTPAYPRPAPPPKRHWTFFAAIIPAAFWLGLKMADKF